MIQQQSHNGNRMIKVSQLVALEANYGSLSVGNSNEEGSD
jgi:hypothetical protein